MPTPSPPPHTKLHRSETTDSEQWSSLERFGAKSFGKLKGKIDGAKNNGSLLFDQDRKISRNPVGPIFQQKNVGVGSS